MTCYIQTSVIMRCVMKGLHCILKIKRQFNKLMRCVDSSDGNANRDRKSRI